MQRCNVEALIHRRLVQFCRVRWVPKDGFRVPRLTLYCKCKGPGASYPLGRGRRRLTRSSCAQSCAASHAPGAAPHCSTELVNDLSLARTAVSTLRYIRTPQSAATLLPCCPAAQARPGTCPCTRPGSQLGFQFQPWEVEDTCKTVPLGEWREAKGVFMHRRPLQSIRPQARPDANPQTTDCSIEGAIICFFVSIHFC